jgi:hypothetical protein
MEKRSAFGKGCRRALRRQLYPLVVPTPDMERTLAVRVVDREAAHHGIGGTTERTRGAVRSVVRAAGASMSCEPLSLEAAYDECRVAVYEIFALLLALRLPLLL